MDLTSSIMICGDRAMSFDTGCHRSLKYGQKRTIIIQEPYHSRILRSSGQPGNLPSKETFKRLSDRGHRDNLECAAQCPQRTVEFRNHGLLKTQFLRFTEPRFKLWNSPNLSS